MRRVSRAETVIERIKKEIRNQRLIDQLVDHVEDLDLRETRMLYDPVDFGGGEKKMTKKKLLDIDWSNHAEYRSELRDVNHDRLNDKITELMLQKYLKNPRDHGKDKFRFPEGVAVVEYDLDRNPAKAEVVTTWASERKAMKKIAEELVKVAKEIVAEKSNGELAIEEAIENLRGAPISYMFGVDQKNTKGVWAKKEVQKAIEILENVLAEAPSPVIYKVVGIGGVNNFKTFDDREDFIQKMETSGYKQNGVNTNQKTRKELFGQPKFDGLAGPMYDGNKVIRYETWEANDVYSR